MFTIPESFKLNVEPVFEFVESLRRAVKIECETMYPKTSSEEELIELAKDADIIVRGMGSSIQMKVLDVALFGLMKIVIGFQYFFQSGIICLKNFTVVYDSLLTQRSPVMNSLDSL